MEKRGFFIEGVPISTKWKLIIISVLFVFLLLNHILPSFVEILDYPFKRLVSIFLLLLFILFSLGSILTEGIVIGLSIFAIMSNLWDLSVFDLSRWRTQVLLGSSFVLLIELLLGKISIINLISIIKKQLGVYKN